MVHVLNGCTIDFVNGKELHSNGIFDKVSVQTKKRPEFGDSGNFKQIDSVDESSILALDNPSIAEPPNSYKDYGVSLDNQGYFSFPRSISSDPRYKGARLKYKHVLHTILEYAAFGKTTHSIGVEVIDIQIGQFCVSVRGLMDLCNEGVKYKDDLVDKNIVERASHFWQRCGFVRQEVRHGKILLTVTVPEFYKKEKSTTETPYETKPRQNRDTKETDKTDKEDNISSKKEGTFVPSEFATSLLSEFYSSLFLSIPDFPKDSARKTKAQYQAADSIGKKCNNDLNLIKKVIEYAHLQGGFWQPIVHSVVTLNKKFVTLLGQMRNQGLKPMNGKKPQPKYNHDTSPSLPSKSISFAEDV
jgi:hypothetical protein